MCELAAQDTSAMTDVPHLSRKERLILGMLIGRGEMYGLELVKESDGELKRGTVYVTLGRMADKGYVESRQADPPYGAGDLPRRIFRATGYGSSIYHAWELASAKFAEGMI